MGIGKRPTFFGGVPSYNTGKQLELSALGRAATVYLELQLVRKVHLCSMRIKTLGTAFIGISFSLHWRRAKCQPKMGTDRPVSLAGFKELYGADPFYHWMGLDNILVYQAARGNSGMTSIYRQLGIGVERLFRHIIMDEFDLDEHQANWSYTIPATKTTEAKTRNLDARIDLGMVNNQSKRQLVVDWLTDVKSRIYQKQAIDFPLKGVVFEVRQGYKSQDSKRSQGDTDNGKRALMEQYQMVVSVISMQINDAARTHYLDNGILVMTGDVNSDDVMTSTFAFMDRIIGYDFAGFFERNTGALKENMQTILEKTLTVKDDINAAS